LPRWRFDAHLMAPVRDTGPGAWAWTWRPDESKYRGHRSEGASVPPARSPTNDQAIEALRVRRAELRESMSALEQALAAPAPGRLEAWTERVHVALVELFSDFREHAIAEGPHGVYRGVLGPTPRLSDDVACLTRDHAEFERRYRCSAHPPAGEPIRRMPKIDPRRILPIPPGRPRRVASITRGRSWLA